MFKNTYFKPGISVLVILNFVQTYGFNTNKIITVHIISYKRNIIYCICITVIFTGVGAGAVAVTPYIQIHAYVSLQWLDFFSFKIYDRVEIVQYVNGQPILQNI